MTTPFISSVKIETRGAHEHVHIWVRGQLVGTLVVSPGDGDRIKQALLGAVLRETARLLSVEDASE